MGSSASAARESAPALQRFAPLRHKHAVQLEHDFAAWADRHDAEALARVFDATGGKLLLLAAHLAGSGQAAPDLVQATFVAAMAHASSWDRARPLEPWLAAILHNELRMQLRRGRRRREVGLDAAADAAANIADPGTLAASQETMAAVLAAIDELPLPYRQVLRLRLVHGLRPVEIARSLEVPVGTVRAQLHRGLERLRGALPAGVAGLVAAMIAGDGALLAQVRERVLERAGELTSAGAGTAGAAVVQTLAAASWWNMNGKTIAVVVAACAALLCLGFVLGAPHGGALADAALSSVSPATAAIPSPPPSATLPTPPAATLRHAAATEVWPLVVVVRDPAGAPIAGADVKVWTAPTAGVFWNRESGDFLREDVSAGGTGADGCFRDPLTNLRDRSLLWRRTNQLWIEASTSGARPSTQILQLPPDLDQDPLTATLELRRAGGLSGRVVDAEGSAVVRADVAEASEDRFGLGGGVRTGTDGRFFLECADEAEAWPRALVITEPKRGTAMVAVPPWADPQAVVDVGDIVLPPATANAITGRLVLGDGSGIGGFQVRLQEFDPALGSDLNTIRRWLMEQGRRHKGLAIRDGCAVLLSPHTNTRPDGSFCFAGLDPTRPYLLDVWNVKSIGTIARPGTEPVELRIDQQLLTIEVVDERGEPLPGAAVHLDGYDPASTSTGFLPQPGFPAVGKECGNWLPCGDDTGRRVHLSPFGFVWRLYTTDEHLQPVVVRHEALPGLHRTTCRIELRAETRFGKLHLVVVDEHGAPLPHGATLKSLDRDLQHDNSRMRPPPEGVTWDLPAGRWQLHVLLGKEVAFHNLADSYVRGSHDEVVTIETGRTHQVKVIAAPAGQVAFRLHSTQPPTDVARGWQGLRIEAAGRAVDVLQYDHEPGMPRWPRSPDGPALPVMFVTKQALPPGRHLFSITADGYQPVRCEATVVADQLTTVTVEMFAH